MQNRIGIYPFDQDQIATVATTTFTYQTVTTQRLNGSIYNGSSANSDAWKYTRYFTKGGLYKVRLITANQTNTAILNLGLDSNATKILSSYDTYLGSNTNNVIKEVFVEISRGYHDITFLVNGKNASSVNYLIIMQALEFDLIQEYPVYQDDRPAQINQGSMVLLGVHKAQVAESTFTFNFADIDMVNKYSEIIVEFHGSTTASLALQCLINGVATGYYSDGWKDLVGTLTGVNFANTTQYEIVGTNIIASAVSNLRARLQISLPNQIANIISQGGVAAAGTTCLQGGTGLSSNNITSIQIKTSASTWAIGTIITVHGVKRQ